MTQDPQMAVPAGWTPSEEALFRMWYDNFAQRNKLDANPDAPEHKYNYRAAFRMGFGPGEDGHWPSKFKALDHPNRFVDGQDTIFEER